MLRRSRSQPSLFPFLKFHLSLCRVHFLCLSGLLHDSALTNRQLISLSKPPLNRPKYPQRMHTRTHNLRGFLVVLHNHRVMSTIAFGGHAHARVCVRECVTQKEREAEKKNQLKQLDHHQWISCVTRMQSPEEKLGVRTSHSLFQPSSTHSFIVYLGYCWLLPVLSSHHQHNYMK